MESENVKVGCLWINDNGTKKTSNLIINEVRYVAWPNDFKKHDTDPDWIIYTNKPLPKK